MVKLEVGMIVQLKTIEQMKEVYGERFNNRSNMHRDTIMTPLKYAQLGKKMRIRSLGATHREHQRVYLEHLDGKYDSGNNTFFPDCFVIIEKLNEEIRKTGYKI